MLRSRKEVSNLAPSPAEEEEVLGPLPPLPFEDPVPISRIPSERLKQMNYDAVWERDEESNPGEEVHTQVVVARGDDKGVNLGIAFSPQLIGSVVCGILLVSLLLSFAVPVGNSNPPPWDKISAFIGWTYFSIWSVSFVPQLVINYRRRSVVGQSLDFVALNTFGFICLTLYSIAFFWVDSIQTAYAKRHDGNSSTVVLNDVCFALWALGASAFNVGQAYYYRREAGQTVMKPVQYFLLALVVIIVVWWVCIRLFGTEDTSILNDLDLLYGLSYMKLTISCIKYLPQLYMNYKRQRTDGWSIENVLCDFSGGFLSVTQQLMDSYLSGNYSGISGNPVKFVLGSLSMGYDVVFVVQHFVLYRKNTLQALQDKAEEEAHDEANIIGS